MDQATRGHFEELSTGEMDWTRWRKFIYPELAEGLLEPRAIQLTEVRNEPQCRRHCQSVRRFPAYNGMNNSRRQPFVNFVFVVRK